MGEKQGETGTIAREPPPPPPLSLSCLPSSPPPPPRPRQFRLHSSIWMPWTGYEWRCCAFCNPWIKHVLWQIRLLQEVESGSASCKKICSCCAFQRPKANLFCTASDITPVFGVIPFNFIRSDVSIHATCNKLILLILFFLSFFLLLNNFGHFRVIPPSFPWRVFPASLP